jgi:hypothetical protein
MARLGCQETSGGDSVKIATEESPRFLIEGERRGGSVRRGRREMILHLREKGKEIAIEG